MKKFLIPLLLSLCSLSFAQTADSSDGGAYMSGNVLPRDNNSSNIVLIPVTVPAGTICGMSKDGAALCQGHNPQVSCPSTYHQAFYGWRGEGTMVCVKD